MAVLQFVNAVAKVPWKLSLRYYRSNMVLLSTINSWQPAIANFIATIYGFKADKQSLLTLLTSYSKIRLSTFVYCRILHRIWWCCSSNAALQTLCLGSHFLIFVFFIARPACLPVLEKWKWDSGIAFLCLLTTVYRVFAPLYFQKLDVDI